MALAASTAGFARYTSLSMCPILPRKFLLVVAIALSPLAKIPAWPPKHGPQVGVENTAPDFKKISTSPSFMACRYIFWVAGITIVRTFGWTVFPFMILAAIRKSLILPFVQDPITDWSILTFLNLPTGAVLLGKCGALTCGSILRTSYSRTSQYPASLSLLKNTPLKCLPSLLIYLLVISSGSMMPDFPPASIAILHRLNLSSIDRPRITSPENSIALYNAPSTHISPIVYKIKSFPLTHGFNLPYYINFMLSGTLSHTQPVINLAARSVGRTPVEKAPRGPYVHVWESAPMMR